MSSKKISLQPPKGFRDFLPEEAQKRQYVYKKMIEVLNKYGFEPMETPALEYASVLEGKYGEEEKMIFKFEDRGGRKLALRFDQTVPMARYISRFQHDITFPFKRYQIQTAWRAEKPQAGRYREFTQCDADIIGVQSSLADAETIAVFSGILQNLGFKNYYIHFNNRKVLFKIIRASEIKKDLDLTVIRILDKIDKLGEEKTIEELKKAGIARTKVENLMQLLGKRPLLPKKRKGEVNLEEIEEITSHFESFNIPKKKVIFSPTLARGLDYYTGLIFEALIEGYEAGSVGGGGRYDNLLKIFSGKKIPAVGFAFGIDRVIEAMMQYQLFPEFITSTKVLVTIFNPEFIEYSTKLVTELRKQGIIAELYLKPLDKLAKQVKFADKKVIPYVIILGPDERENNLVTLKTLKTGKQETIPLEKAIETIQPK